MVVHIQYAILWSRFKMAEPAPLSLSLCDLLCFVRHYAKRLTTASLKNMVHDFYPLPAVTAAKERLQEDLVALNLDITLPRMPPRRDSAKRLRAEIDDIFGLLDFCDLHKLQPRMPKYVSDNLEQLPQLRMEKGDVVVMLNKIDKLQEEMNNLRSDNMSLRCDMGRSFAAIDNRLVSQSAPVTRLSINNPIHQPFANVTRLSTYNPIQQPSANVASAESGPGGDSASAQLAVSRDMDIDTTQEPTRPAPSVSGSQPHTTRDCSE